MRFEIINQGKNHDLGGWRFFVEAGQGDLSVDLYREAYGVDVPRDVEKRFNEVLRSATKGDWIELTHDVETCDRAGNHSTEEKGQS